MATKKKTKRKTKNKKETIKIKANKTIKMGKLSFAKIDKSYWLNRDEVVGAKAVNEDGLICVTENTIISDIFINSDKNDINVMCKVTSKELKKLVKILEKKEKYFKKQDKKRAKKGFPLIGDRFFIHLNPELSFFIDNREKNE